MPFETIAQGDKYSRDQVYRGLVEEIVKVSPILTLLPFDTVLGNSLKYNRELALPAAAGFRAPGATWTEAVHTETQVNVTLKIIGGDADIDEFIRTTRSDENDIEGIVLAEKAKAVIHNLEDEFVYGPVTNGFDGYHVLIGSGAQQVNAGATTVPGAGSFGLLDQLIDLIKPAKPDVLLMSRRTRRQINKFARTNSTFISTQRVGEFGQFVQFYNDIPLFVSDFIVDTEAISSGRFSAKTGSTASSIFALQFGPGAYHGIQAGDGLTVEPIGALETKDARRHRVKWYVAHALKSTLALARLDGLSSADWTN
jgi:hypothetical protein